jgi:flagellar hook-associated protein 1 FlgK
MGDMLSTGVTGLLAFQNALDTISNNVTNVNTPGYSVETSNLVTNPSTQTAEGAIGNGVSVSNVSRSYSDYLDSQTRSATSSYNQFNTVSGLASTIDNMLSDPTTGLSATLTGLSSSIQTMANSPSQTSSRTAVINQLQSVVSQFQSYQNQFTQLNTQVNTQLQTEASTVTSLAQSIASLNGQIQTAAANGTGQAPNNLLDQRDNLIDQLSQHVNVNTVTQSDGTVSVFIGSGQSLVVGNQASTLAATADPFGSGQQDLSLQAGTGSSVDITNALSGGTIGGLLQFRTQMLDTGESSLGQQAVTLTNLLNTQNEAGVDQNGAIGGPLLAVGGPQVLASSSNTGNASVTGSIPGTVANLGGLSTDNDELSYDGTNWSLLDTTTGTSTALTATAGSGGTTVLTGGPGITLTVTGTAKAGDEFLVQPTANAVAGLSLVTTDPTKVAAAGPLVTSANSANTGTASISSATVPNTALWTRSNYTISFSSPTAYTVTNAAGTQVASSTTYAAGTPISFDGIAVTLTGTPAANDSFSVNDNANGVGDNTNALALAGILNKNVLDGGAQSLSDAVNGYVGTVGLQTSQAQNGATAQQAVLSSAQNAQQSVQGVNLDEEAAKMLQYQQAYQAAAEVIATSNTLFNSIITAINTVS